MSNTEKSFMDTFAGSGLRWLWLTAVIIVLDQATKLWVSSELVLGQGFEVLPIFNIVLAHNEGAAFSFLADAGGWQRWFFTVIAILAVFLLTFWMKGLKRHHCWLGISLALILGGAIGNVIDRIAFGYVVDFLDFHWDQYHFPAFNVADTAITVGAVMLGIDMIFLQSENKL